jgi:hypothetical protein
MTRRENQMNAPPSPDVTAVKVERRAATPIAGAPAGILFALLFGVSVTIITNALAGVARETGAWLETGAGQFKFALGLMPFAGLFFLWFIAVVRERLGRFEDQFFATVFLGSGLLFLAMMLAAAASAGVVVASYAVALVLLFIVTQVSWVILGFSAWVFLVSVYTLVTHLFGPRPA